MLNIPLDRNKKLAIAGGSMFIFSILFQTAILPAVLNAQIKRKLALKQGWMMRGIWGKFPFPFDFQFYLFNVTNPDGIKNGEKPIMQEVGPFVYEEWHEKTNQIDHEEDDTVSYTVRTTFYFNAEKSQGLTSNEEIIVPNYFALGLVNTVLIEKPSALPIVGKAIDSILRKPDNIFMRAKVREILFDGIVIDCDVKDFAGSAVCSELRQQYEDFGMDMFEENKYRISLWGTRNGTDSKGRTRVKRGLKNIMDVGRVVEYNNKPNISVWDDPYCDTFNGSDGTVFHPKFDKKGKDDLVAYNPSLCRSISCYYDSPTKFAGMKLLRYTASLGIDGEHNPLHKCYCASPDKCLKKGVYDAYKCLGLPLIVSNPHFYLADPYYLSMVKGLEPVREKHMIAIDLDPLTGSPIQAHTKAQFNLFITRIEKFKLMKNFPEALLPLLWIDEGFVMPDYLLKEVKTGHRLLTLAKVLLNLMLIGGLGLGGFAGFRHFKAMENEKKLNEMTTTIQPRNGKKSEASAEKKPVTISTIHAASIPPNVD